MHFINNIEWRLTRGVNAHGTSYIELAYAYWRGLTADAADLLLRTATMWLAEGQPDRQISIESVWRWFLDSVFAIHRRSALEPKATPIDKNAYEVHFIHVQDEQINYTSGDPK